MSLKWKIVFLLLTFSQLSFANDIFLEGNSLVICQKISPYCDVCTGYVIDKDYTSNIFSLRPIWQGTHQQQSSYIQGQQQGESFQDYEQRLYPGQDLNEVHQRVYRLKDNTLYINHQAYMIDETDIRPKLSRIFAN